MVGVEKIYLQCVLAEDEEDIVVAQEITYSEFLDLVRRSDMLENYRTLPCHDVFWVGHRDLTRPFMGAAVSIWLNAALADGRIS